MKILPNRNMLLDGRCVERGTEEEVSQESGELALRHGWAVEVVEETNKPKKSKKENDQE